MSHPKLTIAIPTYNRPEQLRRCLEAIVPQLNEECWLHIADNHSSTPAAEIAEPILAKHAIGQFSIVRHPFNKGAHGNIFHCLEVSTTPWVWVLGDDDLVLDHAVQAVLTATKQKKNLVAIVGALDVAKEDLGLEMPNQDIEISTLAEYLSSSALICSGFISSLVLSTEIVRQFIGAAYQFSSSFYPHVAIVAGSMQGGLGNVLFLCSPFVRWVGDGFQEWNVSPIYKNMRYLTRMLREDRDREALSENGYLKRLMKSFPERLTMPGFQSVAVAVAFRRKEEARSVLRFGRRQCAEYMEFHDISCVIPIGGLILAAQFGLAALLGLIFGPIMRWLYRAKVGSGEMRVPTMLLKCQQPLVP